MPKAFTEIGRIYVDHNAAVCDLWEDGETTLVHGDSHLGNLFMDAGCVGFLDWAVLSRGPGVRDVSYYLAWEEGRAARPGVDRLLGWILESFAHGT